ncbi:MAG: protein-L-isoaspartate(D-aspartate) O-methyltransferase [Anaerolineae bacterium]|nr:protein-L-isoaspartate(D-aspartate) O-methyltransferase [Anaerolineae bacterium]
MRQTSVILCVAFVLVTACTITTPTTTPPRGSTPTTINRTETLPTEADQRFAQQREQMVVKTIKNRGITDEDVLEAMEAVPRHKFVPEEQQPQAYGDYPLPIGFGQTISQPYIVAMMTELLELEGGDQVLEIGTGSGYQAAVLAELPEVEVYTIEVIPELAERAKETLDRLGYTHVHCKQGDGYYGWPEHAPFDGIIVTAAPDHVPQPLREQLAVGGCMVIPIGPRGGYQTLWKFVKQPDGEMKAYNKGGVAFVPFTGRGIRGEEEGGGWPP